MKVGNIAKFATVYRVDYFTVQPVEQQSLKLYNCTAMKISSFDDIFIIVSLIVSHSISN